MKNVLSNIHISRQAMFYMFIAAVLILMVLHPQVAFASDSTDGAKDGSTLPFVAPLKTLANALTGPFAMTVSLIGIVGAGAMLIFGGDMGGFLRSLVFLVLVIAIIVAASSFMKIFTADGAVIASAISPFESLSRSLLTRSVAG
jgi:type IV secretion system protein VirB2